MSLKPFILYEKRFDSSFGVIRLELWTDQLVFWVGGEIRWRSDNKLTAMDMYLELMEDEENRENSRRTDSGN